MKRLAQTLLGAALLAASASPAAAQLDASFDGADPFAGWTNLAFPLTVGAVATVETAVGGVTPLSGPNLALLRANEPGQTPANFLTDGLGTWDYAAFTGLTSPLTGLPLNSTATGSVLLSPSFMLAGPGTLSFNLNFLANPFDLGSEGNLDARNRDWAMVRLLQGGNSVGTLFFAQVQENGSASFSAAGIGAGSLVSLVNTGDYLRSYNWLNVSAALGAGTYQLEFSVANEGNKQFDAALAIDNVQVVSAVPEPGTWALLATGLLGTGLVARRRRRA